MNLLAFDTSTETMSVAVQRTAGDVDLTDPGSQVWQLSGVGGAQTSVRLIPVIQALMAQAGLEFTQLDAIVFGRGPGSFTGLRTACSVAQGLAFGASVKVLPVDTLLAVAEEARFQSSIALADCQVMALLDARMDEMYAASYAFDGLRWRQNKSCWLVRPEDLVCGPTYTLAGNVFDAYGARLPTTLAARMHALPTAAAMLRLAPALLVAGGAVGPEQALPLYVRDKVAQTTSERAAHKVLA
jgi:tRNA threonylcarbamoyladenosine biosynthesis protein TsaB